MYLGTDLAGGCLAIGRQLDGHGEWESDWLVSSRLDRYGSDRMVQWMGEHFSESATDIYVHIGYRAAKKHAMQMEMGIVEVAGWGVNWCVYALSPPRLFSATSSSSGIIPHCSVHVLIGQTADRGLRCRTADRISLVFTTVQG